jgi:hypothetical protein
MPGSRAGCTFHRRWENDVQLQLLGWGPDLDPATPGVIVDMDGVIPTTDGFRALEGEDFVSAAAATFVARSMGIVNTSTGVHAVVAAYGSDTTASTCTLFEVVYGGTYTARGTYTAGAYTTPVMFRQFDSSMFAAREGSALKRAAKGASFSDATGAPSCSLIESTKDFVIAFNTATGYDWHCCALGNAGDWTPSVSTQSARGILYDKGGPVIASGRFGEYVLAFTQSQTWLGRYVGAPEVWQWEQISRDVGCVGPEAVCETPFGVCWVSKGDVHIYDGQSIQPLNTQPVRETMFSGELRYRQLLPYCQIAFDRKNGLLWLSYASGTPTTEYTGRSKAFAYHFESKKWSKLGFGALAFNQVPTPEYRGLSAAVPTTTYDDFLFVFVGTSLYRLNSDDKASGSGYVVTGVMGDPVQKSMFRAVRAKYSEKGANSPIAVLLTQRQAMAGGTTAQQTATLDADLKYPFRQTGRYHSVKLHIEGTDIVSGIDVDIVPMGAR